MVVEYITNYICNQSSITTNVASSNHAYGEVYSIQHHVIKLASDLRQVDGFLRLVVLNSIILTPTHSNAIP